MTTVSFYSCDYWLCFGRGLHIMEVRRCIFGVCRSLNETDCRLIQGSFQPTNLSKTSCMVGVRNTGSSHKSFKQENVQFKKKS